MSTRSYIGIKNGKTVEAIYCHNSGQPEYNGKTLKEHYITEKKVRKLLALGSISSLGAKLAPKAGTPHEILTPQKGVVFAYHRDRGDELTPALTIEGGMNELVAALKGEWIEHVYLFNPENSKWEHHAM